MKFLSTLFALVLLAAGPVLAQTPVVGGGTVLIGAGSANPTGVSGQLLYYAVNGTTVSASDFSGYQYLPAAACSGSTATAVWDLPTVSPAVVACRAGSNINDGVLQFATGTSAQVSVAIPNDWDTAQAPLLRLRLSTPDQTSGHTIVMSVSVSCSNNSAGTDDNVFQTAQNFGTVTLVTSSAVQSWTPGAQLTSGNLTNCVPAGMMHLKISRTTDTSTSSPNVFGLGITFPRLLKVQAN